MRHRREVWRVSLYQDAIERRIASRLARSVSLGKRQSPPKPQIKAQTESFLSLCRPFRKAMKNPAAGVMLAQNCDGVVPSPPSMNHNRLPRPARHFQLPYKNLPLRLSRRKVV